MGTDNENISFRGGTNPLVYGKLLKNRLSSVAKAITVCHKTTNSNADDYQDPTYDWTNTTSAAFSISPIKNRDMIVVDEGYATSDYKTFILPSGTTISENDIIKVGSVEYDVRYLHTEYIWNNDVHIRAIGRRQRDG